MRRNSRTSLFTIFFCSSSFSALVHTDPPLIVDSKASVLLALLVLLDMRTAVAQWEGSKAKVKCWGPELSEQDLVSQMSFLSCLPRSFTRCHSIFHFLSSSSPTPSHTLTLPQYWPQAYLPSYILRTEAAGLQLSGCRPDQEDPAGGLLATV